MISQGSDQCTLSVECRSDQEAQVVTQIQTDTGRDVQNGLYGEVAKNGGMIRPLAPDYLFVETLV